MKMKINYAIIGLILVMIMVGVGIFLSPEKPEITTGEPNITIQECKEGFTFEKHDENNFRCKSPKKDFECTDTIKSAKGYYVCDYFIDNYAEIPNISYEDLVNTSEQNRTVQVKGKVYEWYIPRTGTEIDYVRQAVFFKAIEIEYLTILGHNPAGDKCQVDSDCVCTLDCPDCCGKIGQCWKCEENKCQLKFCSLQ